MPVIRQQIQITPVCRDRIPDDGRWNLLRPARRSMAVAFGPMLFCCACLGAGPGDPPETGPSVRTAEIGKLIRQLGDRSYARRADALRDLIAIGPDALPLLREAGGGRDAEIALRARNAVAMFDRVLLAGAEISLSAEPASVAWDEPFALRVRIFNGSREPCWTPFGPDVTDKPVAEGPARQVGAMMDLADYLTVTGPDGRAVSFHCDDIDDDLRVRETVVARVEDLPFSELGGGESRELAVKEINRGWARYRMLNAGEYTIRFSYQPDWEDAELVRRGVGLVQSAAIQVTVTRSADRRVREANRPVIGEVALENDVWVARLVNVNDRAILINTNWGDDISRRARIAWRIRLTNVDWIDVPQRSKKREAFSVARLVEVEPLGRVEVGRIGRKDLAEALGKGHTMEPEVVPGFVYTNMLSRGALSRKAAIESIPESEWRGLYSELPFRIFVGLLTVDPS